MTRQFAAYVLSVYALTAAVAALLSPDWLLRWLVPASAGLLVASIMVRFGRG